MSKNMKHILVGILCVCLGYLYVHAQAPSLTNYTVKHQPGMTPHETMNAWLTGYLQAHQSRWNQNDPLIDFTIESLEPVEPIGEEEGWLIFDVTFTVEAGRRPDKLFQTLPLQNNNHYTYNLILYMNVENNVLKYQNDMTEKTYREQHFPTTPSYESDTQASFYDDQNMFLRIRENENKPWIETPIASADFTTSSQGHFKNDKRIFSFKNHHEVLYQKDGNVIVGGTVDGGTTWSSTTIFDEPPLSIITAGYLDFVGETGILALSSHVALNAEIVSYHYTLDNGQTWTSQPIPNYTHKITDASLSDSKTLWVTQPNSPHLYRSLDYGETFTEVALPAQTLNDTSIRWNDIFIQATAPQRVDHHLKVRITQNNGDYRQNADAIFISNDNGNTWNFSEYIIPQKVFFK
ncbi:WD40/YVTN/BNR-like repeat-containing protein [Erysipelothrix sp. strain 2 (EsS2-6-Brazil)]|uniref:WD40/YVTN/BNR-like repeat-containing protein n=1 Tax=Erysipelothrix sp. strain 2 (EsS2-6-Brazil) TaxID=2500549 RepID=UPI00190A99F6|nr:sialidase family protein [Erysipelothrix sp. strain 2 (EsS2-6-Brazil)]MBK2401605.1 exo-alpha-sialidase [Erysipelothrix sp. strain 2 (EsS2-6-Brazil)]